ncbi:MAG TPA: hypothetical protein VGF29_10735 [Hyphomicrobiaceae bacterium]
MMVVALRLPLTMAGIQAMPPAERTAQARRWAELGFPHPSQDDIRAQGAHAAMGTLTALKAWLGIHDAIRGGEAEPAPRRSLKVHRDEAGRLSEIEVHDG